MSAPRIIRGSELQLFINDNAPSWATSHVLTLTAETSSAVTKDHGINTSNEVTALSWELTGEFLYSENDYDMFFDLFNEGEAMLIKFGAVSNYSTRGLIRAGGDVQKWNPAGTCRKGYAIMSNLSANANAGENATFSVTFTGTGSLTSVLPTEDYLEFTMDFRTGIPMLFEVANYDSNVVIYNKTTGEVIPTEHEDGLYQYSGTDELSSIPVRIDMDGTQFINMYSTITGPLFINTATVPNYLWLDTSKQNIDTVIFGDKVQRISQGAFANRPGNDTSLAYKSLSTVPPVMGQDGLGNVSEVVSITVPSGTLSAYQHEWSGYASAEWIEE